MQNLWFSCPKWTKISHFCDESAVCFKRHFNSFCLFLNKVDFYHMRCCIPCSTWTIKGAFMPMLAWKSPRKYTRNRGNRNACGPGRSQPNQYGVNCFSWKSQLNQRKVNISGKRVNQNRKRVNFFSKESQLNQYIKQ